MLTFPFTMFSGKALYNVYSTIFNGVDEYVNLGNAFSYTNNLSVFCWVSTGNITSTITIFSKYYTSISQRSWAIRVNSGGKLRVNVAAVGSGADEKDYTSTDVGTIENNGWHLVGFTFSSNVLKLYVDGVEVTTSKGADDVVNTIHAGTSDVNFARQRNGSEIYNGNIDNTTIWTGTVLSGLDILTLFAQGATIDPSLLDTSATLSHFWKMGDQDTAPNIVDHTGGATGTMVNMDQSNFVKDVTSPTVFPAMIETINHIYNGSKSDPYYINIGNLIEHSVPEISVSMWFKFDELASVQVQENVLISKAHTSVQKQFEIRQKTDNKLVWKIFEDGENATAHTITSTNALSKDVWYHVLTTFKANEQKMYIDGIDVSNGVAATTMFNSVQNLRLASDGSGNFKSAVSFKDVAIYNKAKTIDDAVYLSTKVGNVAYIPDLNAVDAPSDMINYWRFGATSFFDVDGVTTPDETGLKNADGVSMTAANIVLD